MSYVSKSTLLCRSQYMQVKISQMEFLNEIEADVHEKKSEN